MIIAAMYIALGFFTATLLALAVVPLIYKRTVRLTAEAMRATNPANYSEVRAAHDIERARNALIVNRAERAMQAERELATTQRAQVGELRIKLQETINTYEAKLAEQTARLNDAQKGLVQAEEVVGQRSSKAKTLAQELKASKEEIKSLKSQIAEAELKVAQESAQAKDDKDWQPTEDAMSLAIMASLESQLADLQQKVAQYESGELMPATTVEGLEKQAVTSVIDRLEQDLSDLEKQYVIAQAEVARLSALQRAASETDADDNATSGQETDTAAAEQQAARQIAELELKLKSRDRALQRSALQIAKLRQDLSASDDLNALRADLTKIADHFGTSGQQGQQVTKLDVSSAANEAEPQTQTEETALPAENKQTAALISKILKANRIGGKATSKGKTGESQPATSENAETLDKKRNNRGAA